MDLEAKLSCDGFPSDSTSSEKDKFYRPCENQATTAPDITAASKPDDKEICFDMLLSSSSTTATTLSSGVLDKTCRQPKMPPYEPPNIGYELGLAKSIMQQYSTISGDNLFDHLTDIIKRVIDERPPNIIDFFEEFSRSVREQKFHLPERFPPDAIYEEGRMFKVAKKQLISMQLPCTDDSAPPIADEMEEEQLNHMEDLKLEINIKPMSIFHIFNERIQNMQFFWNQCGFSISTDDIFQLACAMSRLQTHPSILQCRFWGIINGLKASYYIVEAYLTNDELDSRLLQMEKEIREHFLADNTIVEKKSQILLPSHIGPELKPGALGWENWPVDELKKMKPEALPVPLPETEEVFDVPPEPMGMGINRFSYFVVNALCDEWIELPIVTPKQIVYARQIKKFFTGNLESDIISYPCYPGKEKHYLRATIARITAGTYVAPKGYYRRMTRKERRIFEGVEDDEMEEEEEEEEEKVINEGEEEEEGEPDNDIVLLKNEKYEKPSLKSLNSIHKWVHSRPNILNQGRVVWFDLEKARRDREKERKRLERLRLLEEMGEAEAEDNEEEDEENEEEGEEEGFLEGLNREIGPNILSSCANDISKETSAPWVRRFTSNYTNENERILLMQSNIWPGAYTFVYDDLCESIYLGWGHKYVARNMSWKHLPPISQEYPHDTEDFIEATDPTVEMEEAYRLSLLKKELAMKNLGEHLSDFEADTHESDDDDDDDDDDEEEEE